jgi:hypothetical protein
LIFNNDDLNKIYIKDEAKGAINDINIKYIKRDISPYNTFVISELTSELRKSINVFGL